ncbi:MAG: sugar ABC transporter permease [Thioalkalivibrio sp.]|nr:sugar ABC transporter permease [Thioalkalivibrio sp.]
MATRDLSAQGAYHRLRVGSLVVAVVGSFSAIGAWFLPLDVAARLAASLAALTCAYLAVLRFVPERRIGLAFALPGAIVMLTVSAVPLVYMLYTSMFDLRLVTFNSVWEFTGWKNYADLLLRDRYLWPTVFRTLEYIVFNISLQVVLGLALAVFFQRHFVGRRVVQTILLIPILTTPVVVSLLWKYLLDARTGPINQLLGYVGIPAQPWLSSRPLPWIEGIPYIGSFLVDTFSFNYAFWSVVTINTWQWTPFVFLICYAGIAALPGEPFEAAKVDGASRWQTFRYLTLPLLEPVLVTVVLIRVIDLLKVYAQIWVLFGNANPTRIINIHLYTLGFVTHEYGKTSALGVMLLVVLSAFTLLVLRWSRRSA